MHAMMSSKSEISRRRVLRLLARATAWGLAAFGLTRLSAGKVWAALKRRLLPADTKREALVSMIPSLIDASRIAPTPLRAFGVMGTADHRVDIDHWRLNIVGAVSRPTSWTYQQILAQPVIERKVLMICPMVFANQGVWRGLAIWPLLQAAGVQPGASHLVAHGPEGEDRMGRRFSLQDVRAGKIFLSYAVNGQPLPVRHGFPLRIVAEDRYGDRWLKYVDKLEVVKAKD
jgi:DMSO/TMAO reductase YedYZ molybdopterin-dependent catalytic subunit